jgi:L-glyceraldehyde 3-phosphate reductase
LLRQSGTPCLIHQPKYSMLNRWIEGELLDVLAAEGIGCAVFSPLAQGLLSDRYLSGIPEGSRADKPHGFLRPEQVTPDLLEKVRRLQQVAESRGQTLAQMAVAWVFRHPQVSTALIGASRVGHIEAAVEAFEQRDFTPMELEQIDSILAS